MATKVEFKRVQTDAEVENIDIKDGQLIYTGTGKTFMDYGNQRIPTGSGGGSVDVDTEMSDTSTNAVQNKVIKEYVDDQIDSIPEEVIVSDTQPTGNDWKLWIDSDEVQNMGSEIESGNNTNGYYVKFADGTMICYGTKYFSTAGWQTITYPVEYVSTPTVLCNSNSGTTESATLVLAKISNIGLTTFRTCLVLTSGYDNGTVNWIAIGRWK